MSRTRTYTERPPASARAARRAWDHFQRTRASERRPIKELSYSPNCYGDGPHWICILEILPHDTMHWNFSESDVTWVEPAYRLQRDAELRR